MPYYTTCSIAACDLIGASPVLLLLQKKFSGPGLLLQLQHLIGQLRTGSTEEEISPSLTSQTLPNIIHYCFFKMESTLIHYITRH